jgi:hypothetical protein
MTPRDPDPVPEDETDQDPHWQTDAQTYTDIPWEARNGYSCPKGDS